MFKDRQLENGFIVGKFRPGDAPGMVECYRETYGDSFPMRYVYDAQAIVERNGPGGQYTLVARTPQGRVAGCAGLSPVDREGMIYEAVQLQVRKEFRGEHLGVTLNDACLKELPVVMGLRVVQVEAVCSTPISQKITLKAGLVPTGLELDVLPGPDGRRVSLLYMVKVFEDRPHTLFLPAAYMDFVLASCGRLGLERGFDVGVAPTEARGVVELERLDFAGLLRCKVRRVGRDFAAWLDDVLRKEKGSIVQVQVDLSQKSAPWAIDLLAEKGFFLGGHLPLGLGGDALMLQRLPFVPDEAAIQLAPGAPEEVRAVVLADRQRAARGKGA